MNQFKPQGGSCGRGDHSLALDCLVEQLLAEGEEAKQGPPLPSSLNYEKAVSPLLDSGFESLFSAEQLQAKRKEWLSIACMAEKQQLSLSTADSQRCFQLVFPFYGYNPLFYVLQQEDQFAILVDSIRDDGRTALMIKNIPKKYSQQTLMEEIDRQHKNEYDFFYLPLDGKNSCNVGYAFINFTSLDFVLPFYKNYNGKKWKRFNSDKVCELRYARMQGRQSLVQHFHCGTRVKAPSKTQRP